MYAQRNLGVLPVLAVPAFLTSLNTALSAFGLNSSDPTRDRQRLARIAQAFSLAVVDNQTPQPNLDNLSGEDYLREIAADKPVAGGGTAAGSSVARRAAQAAIVELGVRRAATGVVGAALPMSTIPAQMAATARQVLGNPYILIGGAAAIYFLFLRRRR